MRSYDSPLAKFRVMMCFAQASHRYDVLCTGFAQLERNFSRNVKLRFSGGLSKTPHPSATPPPSPQGEGLRKAESEANLQP